MEAGGAHVVSGHSVLLKVDGPLGREDEVGVPCQHAPDDKSHAPGEHEGEHGREAVSRMHLLHALGPWQQFPRARYQAVAVPIHQYRSLQLTGR